MNSYLILLVVVVIILIFVAVGLLIYYLLKKPSCEEGEVLENGSCVPCNGNIVEGECIPCPSGTVYENGVCVYPELIPIEPLPIPPGNTGLEATLFDLSLTKTYKVKGNSPINWDQFPAQYYSTSTKNIIIPITGRWNISPSFSAGVTKYERFFVLYIDDVRFRIYQIPPNQTASVSLSPSVNLYLEQGQRIAYYARTDGEFDLRAGSYVTFSLF